MWVELPDAAAVAAYRSFLDAYALDQRRHGRFLRPLNNRLSTVAELMDDFKVVPKEANTLLVVSLLFLAICSLNLVGLLLGKFLARAPEVGVRRALGASRLDIFVQHIVECEVIGLVGGVLGLALSLAGLAFLNTVMKAQGGRAGLLPPRRPDGRPLDPPRARRRVRRGRLPRLADLPAPARPPPEGLLRRRPWNSARSSAR